MAKFDIYEAVTERIIQQLQQGVIPWQKPWTGTQHGAISGTTGKPYSLLNQMLLGNPGEYYTYSQVLSHGGAVRKGEKSQIVVFWKQVKVSDMQDDETQSPVDRLIPMLRYYNVFHIDQCDGLTPRFNQPAEPTPIPAADEIIDHYSQREHIKIHHQLGDEAYYSPSRDCILLPIYFYSIRIEFADYVSLGRSIFDCSVYTENQPVGFYKDYMGSRFDASTNAVFIGEVIECEIDSPDFGAKFVFASDLPKESEQPEIPEETPPAPTRPSHSGHHHSTPSVTPQKDETVKLCAGNAELDPDKPFALAGYGDGQLHENDPITRAQFAVLLYRSLTDSSKAALTGAVSVFSDVANDSWYHDAVSAFASVGVLNGCNGLFCPNDNLTYGQFLAVLTRFVDAKTVPMPNVAYSEHWAYRNIMTAVAYGWIQDAASVQPDRIITRSEVVALVNQIFSQS